MTRTGGDRDDSADVSDSGGRRMRNGSSITKLAISIISPRQQSPIWLERDRVAFACRNGVLDCRLRGARVRQQRTKDETVS
jgi:hypothetical protein